MWLSRNFPRIIVFASVLVAAFVLYTQNNRFFWLYHNDESSKVAQILEGQKNLHHPPLLVEVTDWSCRLLRIGSDPQATVEVGRVESAFYLALGEAFLVDLAVVFCGLPAGVFLALVLLVQPALLEIGHYFKEDTLLLLGLGMSYWAMAFYGRETKNWRGVVLGVALAVLAGSKYVGWFWVLGMGGWAAWWGWRRNRRSLAWVGGVFLVLTIVIYWPGLKNLAVWKDSGSMEISRLMEGDFGTGIAVPHRLFWNDLRDEFSVGIIVIGALTFLAAGCARRPPGSRLFLASLVVMMGLMAWTSKYSDRYILPISFITSFIVVAGPVLFLKRLTDRIRWLSPVPYLAGAVVATVLIYYDLPRFTERVAAFGSDSRADLKQWMQHYVQGPLLIAEDEMVRIGPRPGLNVKTAFFAADLGTVEDLRNQGVTHVIISYDVYHRYVDGSVPSAGTSGRDDFIRRSAFYHAVLTQEKILWQDENRQPKSLHPGLTLIDIRGNR